jgi:hypothetical protein
MTPDQLPERLLSGGFELEWDISEKLARRKTTRQKNIAKKLQKIKEILLDTVSSHATIGKR